EEEEEEEEREEEDEEDPNAERDLGKIFMKRIQWPVQNLAYRSQVVSDLVDDLLRAIREHLPKSFYAVLQTAMKVGSVFEGWDPHEDDAVYQMLVPLKPPCGHTFHLELGSTEDIPERNFSVRVQLECTCTTEQPSEERLCLLHDPEKNLSRNEHLSLLDTLCTRSYLDIHKTALWFQKQVRSAWVLVPQSHHYNMVVLPSSCSCKLHLTSSSRRSLLVEVLFGVQQGDSDIFLSSQSSETTFNPSTTWLESYAVAEFKFFRNMALRVPYNSIHLKCLQIFARIVVGTCFPTYTMKTIVMHLLTTIPLSGWCRRHFLLRLMDIMGCLCCCLENARLNHFFFGNENVPEEIILPPALRTAKPFNLFQHIDEDPATQAEALGQY
ncbi:IPIL1 protein, partial [Oreotrochilus melanogaster]|nr:IPIL1 protein [Oreotrochilus melanogaster]